MVCICKQCLLQTDKAQNIHNSATAISHVMVWVATHACNVIALTGTAIQNAIAPILCMMHAAMARWLLLEPHDVQVTACITRWIGTAYLGFDRSST